MMTATLAAYSKNGMSAESVFQPDDALRRQKANIRRQVLSLRTAMGGAKRAAASQIIREKVTKLPQYQAAQRLAAFAPLSEEVDIWPLLEERWQKQQAVALPKITAFSQREMTFYTVTSKDDLEQGIKKIWQPKKNLPIADDFDFTLVPAVAIDNNGQRLGYGGGFYDTLLARLMRTQTCALVFFCQRVTAVPHEAHDIKMNLTISDDE